MSSDKIRAKVIKEGKDVTFPQVMEIARLEVPMQRHIDRMQETAKVNYVQYGKSSKKKSKSGMFQHTTSGSTTGSSGNVGNPSKHGRKGKKVPLPTDIYWRCGKGRHQNGQDCKALEVVCRNCSIKGNFEKICMKAKCFTHSVYVPGASNNSNGKLNYYNEHGDLVYGHMVSVCGNKCKHLIELPISTKLQKVRNSRESSKCSIVLLKADTGTNVNLMNSKTFDSLFNRKHLQFTSLKMEAYGNHSSVEVFGKFHAFLRWKGKVYGKLFYVTQYE